MAARGRERRRRGGTPPAAAGDALGHHAAVAQRVGLVEEDDHPAVAQREPAQLTEQRLHLEDADAHEHVDERARIDEHVRLAGLARDRLGHQRLAGPGRTPQQQAAGHVAALFLDDLRVLEEDDVLLDPLEHVVLAPDIREPGLDVVGVVHVDSAPGHEPEEGDELEHHEQERERDLQHVWQHVPDQLGSFEQREQGRGVNDLPGDHRDHGDPEHPLQQPRHAEPGPVRDPAVGDPLDAPEYHPGPEPVVAPRVLADQEVDLAEHLQAEQDEHPPAGPYLDPYRVREPHEGIVRHHGPDQDDPHRAEQDQELDPVPEGQRLAGLPVLVPRPPARRHSGGGAGVPHDELLMVNDDITSLISV